MKTFVDLPPDKITRGVIMSMMDTEFPVVECFTDGKDIIPVACLNGLPIPWNQFVIFFCARFSKDRVKQFVPWALEMKPVDENDPIMACWDKIDIPANMRAFIEDHRPLGSKHIIKEQIDLLYERHIKKEVPPESFQNMIAEIDRIYANSFKNPVRV